MTCILLDCYASILDLVPLRPTFVGSLDLIRLVFTGAVR